MFEKWLPISKNIDTGYPQNSSSRIIEMTTLRLSPLRLILLSLGGALIIAIGAFAAVFSLWQPRALQSFLPADSTVALFSNVTREDIRAFTGRFPSFKDVPLYDGVLSLGVLATPNGQGDGWILSSEKKETPLTSVNLRVGRQAFFASDPALRAQLTQGTMRLSASPSFYTLTRNTHPGDRQVFFAAADGPAVLPAPLRPLQPESSAWLVAIDDRRMVLRALGKTDAPLERVTGSLPPLSPPADATVILSNPSRLLELQTQALPEQERVLPQGWLSRKAREMLGGDWSWAYDILPLLQRESSISWRTDDTGLSFLFQGSAAHTRDLRERFTAFHDVFRSRLAGTVTTERTLDRGLSATIIRNDPLQVEDRQQSSNGWDIRETMKTGGIRSAMLLSGIRGREFFITNKREWLTHMTTPGPRMSLPVSGGLPVMGGTVAPALFASLTSDLAKHPGWAWMAQNLAASQPVVWTLERDGQGQTLSLTLSTP